MLKRLIRGSPGIVLAAVMLAAGAFVVSNYYDVFGDDSTTSSTYSIMVQVSPVSDADVTSTSSTSVSGDQAFSSVPTESAFDHLSYSAEVQMHDQHALAFGDPSVNQTDNVGLNNFGLVVDSQTTAAYKQNFRDSRITLSDSNNMTAAFGWDLAAQDTFQSVSLAIAVMFTAGTLAIKKWIRIPNPVILAT